MAITILITIISTRLGNVITFVLIQEVDLQHIKNLQRILFGMAILFCLAFSMNFEIVPLANCFSQSVRKGMGVMRFLLPQILNIDPTIDIHCEINVSFSCHQQNGGGG